MRTIPPAAEHPCPRSVYSAAAALFLGLHILAVVNMRLVDVPNAAPAGHLGLRLDPNSATSAELTLLPGIGPVLATRIVEFRGPVLAGRSAFTGADDLSEVRGIGPKKIAAMREYLRFAPFATKAVQR